jgi:nitrite reductase/ring-hydroxylating ferredoxin subunit
LGKTQPLRMHWSGCPASCGNHTIADIGLLGKNIRLNGEVVEAVDVFAGGAAGCEANFPIKLLEDVPCEDLADVVAGLVKHGAFKAMRQQLRKIPQPAATGAQPEPKIEPVKPVIGADEIKEGAAKLVRINNEEIAVFKHQGQLCAIQNTCPHQGGQLSMGSIEGDEVVCPLHGWRFHLKTGACSTVPPVTAKIFKLAQQGENYSVEE